MKFCFIDTRGFVMRELNADTAPEVNPAKGRWLADNPQAFDPETHTLQRVEPVPVDATEVPYALTPLPVGEITTRRQTAAELEIQTLVATKARELGYQSVLEAISFAGDANPKFAADAAAIKKYRSDLKTHLEQVKSAVRGNARPMPTPAQLRAELPAFVPPVI